MHNGSSGIRGSDMVVEELLPWKMNRKDRKNGGRNVDCSKLKPFWLLVMEFLKIIGNNKI